MKGMKSFRASVAFRGRPFMHSCMGLLGCTVIGFLFSVYRGGTGEGRRRCDDRGGDYVTCIFGFSKMSGV